MRNRCSRDTYINRNHYGRGITVCKSRNESFQNFMQDMYPTYKEGLTIDRIDNDGNYHKENCKWSTYKEQARNRSNNLVVEGKTIAERAELSGKKPGFINGRVRKGMTISQALSIPKMTDNIGLVEFNGEKRTIPEWAKHLGVKQRMLYKRLTRGLSIEDTLTLPSQRNY